MVRNCVSSNVTSYFFISSIYFTKLSVVGYPVYLTSLGKLCDGGLKELKVLPYDTSRHIIWASKIVDELPIKFS